MINLIGFSGKKGTGKDLATETLQTCFRRDDRFFENKKHAAILKEIVCLIIGCTMEDLENRKFKEKILGKEWWCYNTGESLRLRGSYKRDADNQMCEERYLVKMTPRKMLQLLGTEAGRGIIHPNIWINALYSKYNAEDIPYEDLIKVAKSQSICPKNDDWYNKDVVKILHKYVTGYKHKQSNWIISDVRMVNEVETIHDKGGIVIRINRDLGATDQHKSEIDLDNCKDFDYVIENDDTKEEFVKKIQELYLKIKDDAMES